MTTKRFRICLVVMLALCWPLCAQVVLGSVVGTDNEPQLRSASELDYPPVAVANPDSSFRAAPILPPAPYSVWQTVKEMLLVIVPAVLFIVLVILWYLKRLVAKRTLYLELEIKQRQRIEEAFTKANADYSMAQQIGKVGNWRYDIETGEFYGSVEAWRIYGLDKSPASQTMEAMNACIPGKDRVRQALVDLVENGTPYELEFEIIAGDTGKRRTVMSRAEIERDEDGNPVKVNGVIQDITERKTAADALKNSERFLNEMGEIARIGGWEHDLRSDQFNWTRETFRILEIDNLHVPAPGEQLRHFPAEDRAKLEEAYRQTIQTGKPFDLELRCITAKGSLIRARTIGHPEFKAGKCCKMRGTFQDITGQKKIQEYILQSQRLEALGVLAGGVAHDFNNILSAMLGFTELAKEANPDNAQLQEDLEEVYLAGLRAKDLVQQILTFSREKEPERLPLNVADIVKEALKLLRCTLPASIEMEVDIEDNAGEIWMDSRQLHQIVMNICTNAAQAMEAAGGLLTVKVSEVKPSGDMLIKHPYLSEERYVQLHIQDTGTGIEPDVLGLIFDPYFTTKNLGDGTGLGLAVTYGIVRDLGGDIIVESEPGKGCVFTVFLPIVQPPPKEPTTNDQVFPPLCQGEGRILLVDDEPPLLKMISRILRQHGYTVTTADDGHQAMDKFVSDPMAYDLVISDVSMPKMSGNQLAQEILAIRPDLPVLLASGYSKIITEESVMKEGIRGLLQKPFSEEQLLGSIGRLLIKPDNKKPIPL